MCVGRERGATSAVKTAASFGILTLSRNASLFCRVILSPDNFPLSLILGLVFRAAEPPSSLAFSHRRID